MDTAKKSRLEHELVPEAAVADNTLSADDFKAAFRNHAAGVAVVTADAGDGPVAMTATSVFSVSVTPPLLVFSVSALSSATPTIVRSESVVVHLLAAEQVGLAQLCATSGIDRFADHTSWSRLETGEPYFPAAHAWIRGTVINTLQAGSSTLIVVNATRADVPGPEAAPERPLVYHNRTWHQLGEHSTID